MNERKKGYVRAHERAVRSFARQQGITKGSALIVLIELLACRNYKTLTAFRSRDDLVEDTGYCDKTVKKAMATLRKHGVITPVAYEHGGRGCATVYSFRTKYENGGKNVTPYDEDAEDGENGGTFLQKEGNNIPDTGEQSAPPTISKKSNKGENEPPRRRQEAKPRPKTAEEQAQFSQLEREYSTSYAISWWKDLLKKEVEQAE